VAAPPTWTRLVASSMKKSTYRVFRNTVSTVKKSQARTPLPCALRNSLHVGPVRRGAGPRPPRRRIRLIELAPMRIPSLRSSPWIRTHPHRVLPTESRNELDGLDVERRPARSPLAVGPLPSHELAVPPEERLRHHHERAPSITAEPSACRGEEGSIPIAKIWAMHTPPQNLHLVTEHGVLQLKLGHATGSREHSDQANEHEVQEGLHGPRMLPTSGNHADSVLDPHRPTLGCRQLQQP
jgi:hypothetical protein